MSKQSVNYRQIANLDREIFLFCKEYFNSECFEISNTSLSAFNKVYKVKFDNQKFIVKFSSLYNPISLIRVNADYIVSLLEMSKIINKKSISLIVPLYCSTLMTDIGAFFLMKEYAVKPQKPSNYNLHQLGLSLREFHQGDIHNFSNGMIILPWNHFSPEFRHVFIEHNRWETVNNALNDYFPGEEYIIGHNLVINHNDIHSGNIFASNSKDIYLDLNEMCIASPLNDIGIVVANYIINPTIKPREILEKLTIFLAGYCNSSELKEYLDREKEILSFALRKLLLIEGYFLYTGSILGTYDRGFIQWLRQSQENIKQIIKQ